MKPWFRLSVLLVSLGAAVDIAKGDPLLVPGGSVIPGNDNGVSLGTLLATQQRDIKPFTSNNGIVSGKFTSAVYLNGGFDDFYYQVSNDSTSTAAISLVQVTPFLATLLTGIGARTDGSALGGLFIDGTVLPTTVNLNSTGTVGFNFILPVIQPGEVSAVLILETNATSFTAGTALIGDPQEVETYATPEPTSLALLIGVLLMATLTRAKYRVLR